MGMCEFKNEKICVFTKKECNQSSPKDCKYYNRQYPKDQNLFNIKVFKTLKESISKRDIFDSLNIDYSSLPIDYSSSVYENVKNIVDTIKFPIITLKERRKINPLTETIEEIVDNLYEEYHIEILQKVEKDNSLVVLDLSCNKKFIYFIKNDLKEFLKKLKKTTKKEKLLKDSIKRIKPI